MNTFFFNNKSCRLIITLTIVIIFLISCGDKHVSMESLLLDMVDREQITYFPEQEYKLKQFSSYDRRSLSPNQEGWFANEDYSQFIREDENMGRREFVLFDDKGAGAIVRWWMTFAGGGSSDGILRIYIDDAQNPVVEDSVLKVISGHILTGEPLSSSVSPETDYHRRGHNLYLPIPYNSRCMVTYECDSIRKVNGRMKPSIYYNINYRKYSSNTKVESFSREVLSKNSALLDSVNKVLKNNTPSNYGYKQEENILAPGDTLRIEINQIDYAIRRLRLKIDADNRNQALRSTVIQAEFDGNNTIWVPVGDFFGTGFKLNASNTWYSGVSDNGYMESLWIMPFHKNARIYIINFGDEELSCHFDIMATEYKWTDRSMYLAASWHEYNRIQTAGDSRVGGNDKHTDINYVDIEGKGIYAGDAITIFNTVDAWWGEGDEKIYVDDEIFPSSIGTGTEDYYGYAWCRPEEFSHPFIAQPSGKGNFHPGMTVNIRYRVLDAIPFNEKISSNIELWHWVPATINYALTSYFYVMPGYRINIKPDPSMVKHRVPSEKTDLINNNID